jgi:predicted amidohydrolase
MQAAAIQMSSTRDGDRNLASAGRLVGEAAGAGADLVVLPEKWPWLAG